MVRLKFTFGPYEVMVEGQTEHDIFHQANFWGEVATHCSGRPNAVLRHRVSQGYDFYELEDVSTGERFKFGQRKEDNGLFPKGPWEYPPAPQQQTAAVARQPVRPPQRPPAPQPRQAPAQTIPVRPMPPRPAPAPRPAPQPQYAPQPQPEYPPQPEPQYDQPPEDIDPPF